MRVLVVDDEISLREYLDVLLTKAGYEVTTAANLTEARALLAAADQDLVISDMRLGSESGLDVLRAVRALASPPEVILITAFGSPESAVEAMRAGAYDYICKPFDNEELKLLVQKALEKRHLLQENRRLRTSAVPGTPYLAGQSLAMQRVWEVADKVASTRSTVLITGESGTGKEVVARVIHWKSPRASKPFLPVNCAALAEGVLESELFGHVRGAFTGATQDRPGILVSAGDGTVFLDEIGEIPPAVQVKLLRVLQERKVKPVGSTQEIPFNARVLAATNKRLEVEVQTGRFREDLFYRLNVITIEIPPLRERAEDIPALADFFLGRMREELGRPTLEFSERSVELLQRYAFPGNIRQLENVVERAATLADGQVLEPDTLPASIRGETELPVAVVGEVSIPPGFSLERYLDDAERRYLSAALEKAGGVKTYAAEVLGLSFRSFRYRLAKHGMSDREG